MAWLLLGLAIVAEVAGTLSLKASLGFTKLVPSVGVVLGYAVAFAGHSPVPSHPPPPQGGAALALDFAYPSECQPPPFSAKDEREIFRCTGWPQTSWVVSAGSVIFCETSKVPQRGQSYS